MKTGTTYRRRRKGVVALTALATAAAAALLLPLSGAAGPQSAPTNTKAPSISGNAQKDATLVADTGTWDGTTPISFAFAWQRCDDNGANCNAIASATNTTYVVQSGDVGGRIRVQVTASNVDGSAVALSDATDVVTAGNSGAPVNQEQPGIGGSPTVGQKLTATNGTWTGAQPMSFRYQWVQCGSNGGKPDGSDCAPIKDATQTTYVLQPSDSGKRIRVRVTATNSVGSQTYASNATPAIGGGKPPVNTSRPSVSGSMVDGSVVTLVRGKWSGTGTISYSFQWVRCTSSCIPIPGATGTQYRLTSSDVGTKVRVVVTARSSSGSATIMTNEGQTVAPAGPAGVITLPSGQKSIPVTSVSQTERLIVDKVVFTPPVLRSRVAPFSLQVHVVDTRGYVVRDAMVFARSTPLVTRAGQDRRPTATDGWVVFQMSPTTRFPTRRSGDLQFFIKAYRVGDKPLAGVAGYRLVQVRLGR